MQIIKIERNVPVHTLLALLSVLNIVPKPNSC
jgi:hypothetical protein